MAATFRDRSHRLGRAAFPATRHELPELPEDQEQERRHQRQHPLRARKLDGPEHAAQSDRIGAAVRTALARADAALAPYPYADLTILDLPWRSPAETMAP